MSPPPDLLAGIQEIVSAVEAENGFAESFVRTSKVGGRLDVEIDFAVPASEQPVSLSVGFTADRRWAV